MKPFLIFCSSIALLCPAAHAQKIVSSGEIHITDGREIRQPALSTDGHRMGLFTGKGIVIINLADFTYEEKAAPGIHPRFFGISHDLAYSYGIQTTPGVVAAGYTTYINHHYDAAANQTTSLLPLGFTHEDDLVVSEPFFNSYNHLAGFIGLKVVSVKNLKVLKVLTTDTLSVTDWMPRMNTSGRLLLVPSPLTGKVKIFPMDGRPAYSLSTVFDETFSADDNAFYHCYISNYGKGSTDFTIYSLQTGKILKETIVEGIAHSYFYHNNLVYECDPAANTVVVMKVENEQLKIIKTYKPKMSIHPYTIAVGAGDLFITLPWKPKNYGDQFNDLDFFDLNTGNMLAHTGSLYKPDGEEYGGVEKRKLEEQLRREAELKKILAPYQVGATYTDGANYIILRGYDMDLKKFKFWRPRHEHDSYEEPGKWVLETEDWFKLQWKLSPDKQWQNCETCNGTGMVNNTYTTTRTKDLPWGYFDGVTTTSTRTTTTTKRETCTKCFGKAIVLK